MPSCPIRGKGDPFGPDCRITAAGGREQLPQNLVDLRIAGNDVSACRRQKITCVENGLAGNIRMNDASVRVDKAHAGAQTVKRVGESRCLGGLEIDNPGDQHRAPDMRNDEPQAPASFVVDHAIAFVAKNAAAGNLQAVLEDWTPPFPGLRLYYPGHGHMIAGLRAFVDMLREERKSAAKGKAAARPGAKN